MRGPINSRLFRLSLYFVLGVSVLARADDILKQIGDGGAARQVLQRLAAARQQRLSLIARERERVLTQIPSKEKLIEFLTDWAISDTRLRSRVREFDRETSPRQWRRAWDRRENMLTQLVHFKEQSHPAIVSGRALNVLLNVCGPAAVRRQRRWKSEHHEIDDRILDESSPDGRIFSAEGRRLLANLRYTTVPPDLIRRIGYTQGIATMKRTGRLDQRTALDLEWPLTLREPEYADLRREIVSHRDVALRELSAGKPVSPKTAARLMGAVDRLRLRADSDLTRIIKSTSDARVYWPYRQSVKHMDALTHGVVRFVSAAKLEDVQLKPFDGTTVEDLLVYMHSNAITFAPAGPNADIAYSQLFDLLSAYYIDSILVDQLLHKSEFDLEDLVQTLKQLNQALGEMKEAFGEDDAEGK